MNRFFVASLPLVLAGLPLMAGQAKSLDELTQESTSIVLGRVSAANSYRGPDGEIYTDVVVESGAVLKGSAAGTVEFTVKGGVIGDTAVLFSDSPRFESGEDVLVFSEDGAPIEKIALDTPAGLEAAARVIRLREESDDAIPAAERERAGLLLRRIEAGAGRGGRLAEIELNAGTCSAFIGPKWTTPALTYTPGANLATAWQPALQAAALSWTQAGSKAALTAQPGGPHSIGMGDLGTGGTLASTRVEYSPSTNRISRFSMTFNSRVGWTISGEAGKFDVQAIAAHEMGHALGLDHPGAAACSEQTMWATAAAGETKKRSLEAGDKEGAVTIYGPAGNTSITSAPAPTTPAAPSIANFAIVAPRAMANRPFSILVQGAGFDPASVQALITGGVCGTAGCVANSFAASGVNVIFSFQIPAGSYSLAVRNSRLGALAPARQFTVDAN